MKLSLEIALGVVMGGLALDGIHAAQRLAHDHWAHAQATTTAPVATSTPKPPPQKQESIRGYPTLPTPPSQADIDRWNAMADAAEEAAKKHQ